MLCRYDDEHDDQDRDCNSSGSCGSVVPFCVFMCLVSKTDSGGRWRAVAVEMNERIN